VADVFSDNMVLQRDAAIPVWGTADAGEEVTVSFAGQRVCVTASNTGYWMLQLSPMAASFENRTMTVSGRNNTVTINNCLVGEVWLCSGQSNMAMPMWSDNPRWRAGNGNEDVKSGVNNSIRIVTIAPQWSNFPQTTAAVEWKLLDENNGRPFSAVAFYFGQELFKALNEPVGLVVSSWPGSVIEPFIPPCGFDSVPQLKPLADTVNIKLPGTPQYREAGSQVAGSYQRWLHEFNHALQNNLPLPPPPDYPALLRPATNHQYPTVIYNSMIHPLVPFKFKGIIWYQGCSNLHDGLLYRYKMQALLNGLREVFHDPEMPFYFVQLAPWDYTAFSRGPYDLPVIWEAQSVFAAENNHVGMAIINDAGDINDIHPADKRTVGNRLARLALRHTYQQDIPADPPRLSSWEIRGNRFILSFQNVETWQGVADHFEIAGPDGKWVRAQAEISGKDLIVYAPQVPEAVQLRYLWYHTLAGVLFNEAGLPLGAFRCGNFVTKNDVIDRVTGNAHLIYQFDLKKAIDRNGLPGYLVDNSPSFRNLKLKRLIYVVELLDNNANETWAVIAMDAFTDDVSKAGIPVQCTGVRYGIPVTNLTVYSNAANLKTGNIPRGNIEFWGCDYLPVNGYDVHGADPAVYDFGDVTVNPGTAGYGSMQIHNFADKQVIFAYNNFYTGNNDIGIGNAPGSHTDWTFSRSGQNYSRAILRIFAEFE
jgi:sialate O-acetylesterase